MGFECTCCYCSQALFVCLLCDFRVCSLSSLSSHMEKAHKICGIWRCNCDVTFWNLNELLVHARKHFIDVVTRETIQDEVSFQPFANHSSQAIVLESERNRNGRMQSPSVDYSGFVVGNGDGDDGGDVMMDKNK